MLNRPPTTPASNFVFPLAVHGLTPSAQADGSVTFANTDGAVVLTIPPGFAQDSAVDAVTGSGVRTAASIKLLQQGPSMWAIQVSVDSAWLRDPARVYPVSVDPSIVFDAGLDSGHWDAFASQSQPTSNFNGYVDTSAYNDYIGIPTAGQQYYTYEKYDLIRLHGHHVTKAMWNGYFYSANTYTNNSFAIYQAAGSWTDSTLTWNNQPGHTTYTPALGSTSGPDEWVPAVDITGWAQAWVDNSAVNYGISIDSRGMPYFFKLAADEQAWAAEDSYLEVTFDNTAPTWPSQASQLPANGSTVMSTTPTLSVPAQTDAEGDPIQYWFRVATVDDAETGQALNSGWVTTPSWTVPAGALQDGVTYYWKVFTWDGWGTSIPTNSSWPPSSLKVDLRLGDQSVSPVDSEGPVSVNLANGNAVVHAASPSFPTVGGSVGVSYTYNSGAPTPFGVTGSYFNGCYGPSPVIAGQPVMVRRDPAVQFNWTSSSPAPGVVDVDNYCVEWSGSIITPSTQSFCFNATRDDGVRIWVNNTLLVDSWTDQAVGSPPWSSTGSDCTSLTAGVVYPLKVDYYEHGGNANVGLWVKATGINPMPVPSSWFTAVAEALPNGWSLSAGARELSYASAKVSSSSVTLVEPSGATHEYRKVDAAGLGWTPPAGEDAVLTSGTENGQPVYVVADTDGLVYTFDAQGKLLRAVSSTDDVNAAAATYAYGGNGQVSTITDPVSGLHIDLLYSATSGTNPCGPPVSGFSTAPNGMLCQVNYWDGTSTVLSYNANGQLARISDPGGATTDFAYDSAGRLSSLRNPLEYDAVMAPGGPPNDDTTRTLISYNSTGRASQVTLAAPTTGVGVLRPNHSYRYVSGTETQVDVAGLSEPNGYAQRAVYDAAGRLTTEYDTAGLATTKEWDTGDRVTASNDPAGRRSTSVYDTVGRPTDTYGPAPASCFIGQVPNGSCTGSAAPPHSTTAYDEGVTGLAAAYWPNQSLAGAATSHATGVGDPAGALNQTWGTTPPAALTSGSNWSARYTGDITFPSGGTYTLKVGAGDDQGVRVFVDDKPIVDAWAGRSAPAVASWGANRLDLFARGTGNAIMHKFWNGTGWSSTWENLGGSWTSDAAAVSWGSNRIDLFARGGDNALWHKWWDGSWHDWESLRGTLTSAPAVSSWGPNRLDVFAQGTGNAVYQKTFNGTWGAWASIGGNVASEPAAASWGSNRIDVFARGTDNTLQHEWFNGTWSGWESLGGTMTSSPDVASWGLNRLDVFYRGSDNTLNHKFFDGLWHAPESLGGALSTAPGVAVTPGTTRLDVFAQGADTTFSQLTFNNT